MPSPDGPVRPSPSSGPSGEPSGVTSAHDATLGSGTGPAGGVANAPSRFEIRRLGIAMRVLPVGVAKDGQMALPRTPAEMGWYEYGPRPGDSSGATVMAGHLDMPGYGTGPLGRLDELRKGDVITVRSGTTVSRYRVDEVLALKKATLDLASLFSRDGPARLHVVTCGGRFDPVARKYDENIVVVATPVA
ncbi:class F sortase [Intrasporangium oryzae]|uniref:class F sortase n=1 Tax=Intrasporangium oryzae TaxID=412687 RepID=UPI002480DF50|nr:class F sortase [Intrasporangium oryzae]